MLHIFHRKLISSSQIALEGLKKLCDGIKWKWIQNTSEWRLKSKIKPEQRFLHNKNNVHKVKDTWTTIFFIFFCEGIKLLKWLSDLKVKFHYKVITEKIFASFSFIFCRKWMNWNIHLLSHLGKEGDEREEKEEET
jgi:hypothetical protein